MKENEIRIVIGQRGWVWVGEYSKVKSEIIIENAFCIRTWGTKNGLGELCNGPLEQTILDAVGTVRIHKYAVVATYDCDTVQWKAKLLKKK